MAHFFISVKHISLAHRLSHVFAQDLLLLDGDPYALLLLTALFLTNARVLNSLQFVFLLRLEGNLALKGLLSTLAETVRFIDVAGVVLFVLVVAERVLVGWLCTEPGRGGQFDGIGVRSEHFVNVSDGLLKSGLLLTILLKLLQVGDQIVCIDLILNDINLIAHSGLKSLLESLKINEAFLLRIEHIMHQSHNFLLAREDLVLLKMVLKVLVRNETVAIDIHLSENGKKSGLAIKDFAFDLHK